MLFASRKNWISVVWGGIGLKNWISCGLSVGFFIFSRIWVWAVLSVIVIWTCFWVRSRVGFE